MQAPRRGAPRVAPRDSSRGQVSREHVKVLGHSARVLSKECRLNCGVLYRKRGVLCVPVRDSFIARCALVYWDFCAFRGSFCTRGARPCARRDCVSGRGASAVSGTFRWAGQACLRFCFVVQTRGCCVMRIGVFFFIRTEHGRCGQQGGSLFPSSWRVRSCVCVACGTLAHGRRETPAAGGCWGKTAVRPQLRCLRPVPT